MVVLAIIVGSLIASMMFVLALRQFVGLVALAVAVFRRAPSLAAAYVLLLGSSMPGQLLAIFSIAPMKR